MDMYALELRPGLYAVRPIGQLGTCGWFPAPWVIRYINANTEQEAVSRAHK